MFAAFDEHMRARIGQFNGIMYLSPIANSY